MPHSKETVICCLIHVVNCFDFPFNITEIFLIFPIHVNDLITVENARYKSEKSLIELASCQNWGHFETRNCFGNQRVSIELAFQVLDLEAVL